jgi:parvulin-like peptidyl-prolyl isomerase
MSDNPRPLPDRPTPAGAPWRDIRQVSVGRSIGLMGLGAVIGLGLAGYALFTARGTSTLVVPAEDVALVNQQPISRSDFLLQLQALYAVDLQHSTREEREKVLNDMIREELFVQRGKELDVASNDSEVRSAMVNAVELEIAADALTTQPTEAQLQAFYDAHRANYASEGIMTVHDYVFPKSAVAQAADAVQSLKSAPPTAASLARWGAKDSPSVGDEEFYFAAKIHLGDRLFDIARGLADGASSTPIDMPDGIHVLYMVKNKPPVPYDFAAARDQVLNDYRNKAIARLGAGDEAFLRKRANVLIAKDLQ